MDSDDINNTDVDNDKDNYYYINIWIILFMYLNNLYLISLLNLLETLFLVLN